MKKHLAAGLGIVIAAWIAGGCGSRASLDPADFDADGYTTGASGESGASGDSGATSGDTSGGPGSQGAGGTTTSGGSQSTGQGGASNGSGNGSGPGSGPGSSGNGSGPGSSGNGSGGAPNGSSGSGQMTCPTFGGPCLQCVSQVCPEVWCGCAENPECFELFQCAGDCDPGDEACQQACMTAHPDGISDVLLVSDCAGSACDSSCSWGNDVPPCTECLLEDCSDEMNACLATPECLLLLNCLDGCAKFDLACQQACYDDHGAGVPTLQPVLECSLNLCQGSCPN